jgi:hypothetical protein
MAGTTFVIGFEGTGGGYISTENWRLNPASRAASFVSQCIDRAAVGARTHYGVSPDGPGLNCNSILYGAIRFFEGACSGMGKDYSGMHRHAASRSETMPPQPQATYTGSDSDRPTIFVFGYSRGGYIAMCFCEYLRQVGLGVRYLGLFDAVDRDATMDGHYATSVVPTNVQTCYHAIRDPKIGSRPWFGNTGTAMTQADWHLQKFPGTHAAMGGFPLDTPEQDPSVSMRMNAYLLYLDPNEETAASVAVAAYVGGPALKLGGLSTPLVAVPPSAALVARANRLLREREEKLRVIRDVTSAPEYQRNFGVRRPAY